MTGVTVVVPTRDRPATLGRCLAALAAQGDAQLEVIVVDDGSRDADAVRRVVTSLPAARLVRFSGRGPAAARNAGVAHASFDVVLFLDDDCIPAADWADELEQAVRREAGPVGGRTTFDRSRLLLAASEAIVAHAERRMSFAATRNVGVPTSVARATPFDERFVEAGGEDREWWRRLARDGHAMRRTDAAVVTHDPRMSLALFWRQHVRYGRAARIDPAVSGSPRDALGLVAAGFRHGVRVGSLVLLAQVATLVGYARPGRAR